MLPSATGDEWVLLSLGSSCCIYPTYHAWKVKYFFKKKYKFPENILAIR